MRFFVILLIINKLYGYFFAKEVVFTINSSFISHF